MNMEASDQELLRAFVRARSEDAFRQMVDRHLNLVFATARRILGDPQLAEEIAQGVFLLLARQAGDIGSQQPLAGWLYHTARHHALNASRAEGRRRQREHTAAAMQTTETTPEPEWIAAELEGALEELPAEDRDALVLRFLDNRQLREVGVELGISEEAARKRVSRALDKLRGIFGKRGVALTTGLLTTALAAQAGAAAPAGLGATIVASALTGLTAASATALATQTTATTMSLYNLKAVTAILGAAAVTGTTTYLVQETAMERLRLERQSLEERHSKVGADLQDAMALIKVRDGQIAALTRDATDVHRLRADVDRLNRETEQLAQVREENRRLSGELQRYQATLEKASNAQRQARQEAEVRQEQVFIGRLQAMKLVGGAQLQHANESDGWFPQDFAAASLYLKSPPDDIELLFTGHQKDIGNPAATLIARSATVDRSVDGRLTRGYTFADGHSEIHSADTMESLIKWEDAHRIPQELQSRRP